MNKLLAHGNSSGWNTTCQVLHTSERFLRLKCPRLLSIPPNAFPTVPYFVNVGEDSKNTNVEVIQDQLERFVHRPIVTCIRGFQTPFF